MDSSTQPILFRVLSEREQSNLSKLPVWGSCRVSITTFVDNSKELTSFFPNTIQIQLRGHYLLECGFQMDQFRSGIQLTRQVKISQIWNDKQVNSPNYTQNQPNLIGITLNICEDSNRMEIQKKCNLISQKTITLLCVEQNNLLTFFHKLQNQSIVQKIDSFKRYYKPKKMYTDPFHYFLGINLKNQKQYFIKAYSKNAFSKQYTMNQFFKNLQLVSQLNHPGILNIENIYQTSNTIYIVSQPIYLSLKQYISQEKQINHNSIQKIMKRLFEAIDFLHKNGISHNSVSPDTIFLERKADGYYPLFLTLQRNMNYYHQSALQNMEQQTESERILYEQQKIKDVKMLGFTLYLMITRNYNYFGNNQQLNSSTIDRMIQEIENPEYEGLFSSAKQLIYYSCSENISNIYTASQILELAFFKQSY